MTTRTSFSVSRYAPRRGPLVKLTARDSVLRRLDWPMLLSALVLSLLGSLLVWSATRAAPSSTRATRTTSSSGTSSTPASASP